MSLNPIGTLANAGDRDKDGNDTYRFRRGVDSFPSIGDSVLVPTQRQLKAIVESGENRRVAIGTSPLAADATVMIDPDRLFGRHLAVLGNTGSGKSCSVAGMIQWSIQAARDDHPNKKPNARFIILDPNGEYSKAFKATEGAKIFAIEPNAALGSSQLQVPLWFWNSAEWCAFTQASARAQRPLLRRALREVKTCADIGDANAETRRKISTILISLKSQVRMGENYEGWKFGPKLEAYKADLDACSRTSPVHSADIEAVIRAVDSSILGRTYQKRDGGTGYNDIPAISIEPVLVLLSKLVAKLGGIVYLDGPNEDTPLEFSSGAFATHLEELANSEKNPQFFDFLTMRIRTMLSDVRMKPLMAETERVSLDSWLTSHLGDTQSSNGAVTVIDLSLMPAELLHITTAVIARMIFEALQRYRKMEPERKSLPTVLVMEEAHSFIKRYKEDVENPGASAICYQVFEKIAREGRKFGLGLVLSSQRPSELSPTVLSQCNSFLLHRINNDRDQEQVYKLIPDNLKGLLRDLPSLPSQHAILLGWASELPVLVRMRNLPKANQPQSDDPDFWDV